MKRILIGLTAIFLIFSCNPRAVKKEIPKPKPAPNYPAAYIIKETVNLRADGNTASTVVKQLKDGEKVYLIQNEQGWYEVRDENGDQGWLRSDLVGPEDLSYTRKATFFVDSLLPRFNSQMFFDKEDLYKTAYLILPDEYYKSESKAETYAKELGTLYQEKVYPGDVELRVMTKDRKNLFKRINIQAIGNPNTPVPVIEAGRLISLTESNHHVKVKIAVKEDPGDKELLGEARKISRQYELPYTKAEIYIARDIKAGLEYLKDPSNKPVNPETICLLYYLEDKDGEYYKFDFCAD
jgi:hypothetical protein